MPFFTNLTSIRELEAKTRFMFVNFQSGIDQSEALPSNVISVGGLQIEEPQKLPKNVEEFINSGVDGTILFSLGTNVKSHMVRNPSIYVETIKRLPNYNFIWKFDAHYLQDIKELPKNLMVMSWIKQNDILAHPRVVAFISHVGLLSAHEAVWHGKPVIGIPVYSDQHRVRASIFFLVFNR